MAYRPHAPRRDLRRRLALAMVVAALFALLEVAGGLLSGSLALLSDAGHLATDVLAMALSLWALRVAERPHTPRLSFGYHRVEVLAALVNVLALVGLAAFFLLEAYGRFLRPGTVEADLMLLVGLAGLGGNVVMLALLRSGARRNINVRGAFLHVYGDTLGSGGVVVGALWIRFTGLVVADLGATLFIVGLMLYGGARLARDAVRIVLEASPTELDPRAVADALADLEGVVEVHDLHIWTVTSDLHVLTGHLRVPGDLTVEAAGRILARAEELLRERFGIAHATLQLDSLHAGVIPPEALTPPDGPPG